MLPCPSRLLIAVLASIVLIAPASAQDDAKAGPEIVAMYEERFPQVMNATLIGRDCADHDQDAMRELGAASDQLIKYADPKPELGSGVAKVFEGQIAYENDRAEYGAKFCKERAPEIVTAGLESARLMIEKLGLEKWDANDIDVAGIETKLVAAREALGGYDNCRKWTRDAEIAAQSRSETFVSIQRLVSDIKNESASIEKFLNERKAAPGLSERLAEAENKGRAKGEVECSVRDLANIETELASVMQRHGLQ
jgi:hypothetical protein